MLANQALNYLVSGKVPKRIGNAHPNIVPTRCSPPPTATSSSRPATTINIVKLCNVLGAPELARNPKYKDNVGRLTHREELVGKLSALTKRMQRDDCSPSWKRSACRPDRSTTLEQVFEDPQVKHRGMQLDLPSAAAKDGTIPGVRTPIVIDGWKAASEKPSPLLGEHTAEILKEIGEA